MIFSRYHRRNPVAIAKLALGDLFYWFYAKAIRPCYPLPKHLNRILLVNPAHLGDVVVSTALIREIKRNYPECKIDFLAGDWSAPILKDHPGIERAYFVSHWHANRGNATIADKKRKYEDQVKQVMDRLKKKSYDTIFFLNSYEPSFISLFKNFKCPLVGYGSAGGGPLLTSIGESGKKNSVHEVQLQAQLFEPWLVAVKGVANYQPWLKDVGNVGVEGLIPNVSSKEAYVVIHPGSGNPAKEWPLESWVRVINVLQTYPFNILITGHGEREAVQAATLIEKLANSSNAKNLVGQLNFDQFSKVISGAKAVFCVDSVAGHIAGSYGTPTAVITNGLSKIERWHPLGKTIFLLENQVPCSPCHSNPCAQRACITGIAPQSLINQLPRILQV